MQRGMGGGSNSRSMSNNSSHGPAHHHHGSFAHQRGHRVAGVSSHGYPSGSSPSIGRASSAIPPQSDGVLSRSGSSGYMHNAMNEYSSPGLSLGWHSSGSAPYLGPSLHGSNSNGANRSGHGAMGGHAAKRHRGLDVPGGTSAQAGPHHDALMELARENLLLKHQLHVATTEVTLLSVCLCPLPLKHL
jgi:hypothetical protein